MLHIGTGRSQSLDTLRGVHELAIFVCLKKVVREGHDRVEGVIMRSSGGVLESMRDTNR